MKKSKTDHEIIAEVNKLMKEHPNARIRAVVSNSTYNYCDDNFACSFGNICDVEYCHTYDDGSEYVHKDDQIEDALRECFELEPESESMTGEQIDEVVGKEYDAKLLSGEIKEEILIYVR